MGACKVTRDGLPVALRPADEHAGQHGMFSTAAPVFPRAMYEERMKEDSISRFHHQMDALQTSDLEDIDMERNYSVGHIRTHTRKHSTPWHNPHRAGLEPLLH
jgi:hypothetical protein